MKQQKNIADSRISNQQRKVFKQKNPNSKKPPSPKQESKFETINKSILNDTIDQFINTTDINLDNTVDKSQIIPFSPTNEERGNNNLDIMNNSIHTQVKQLKDKIKINKINQQNILDNYDLVQISKDNKNFTISTPSIMDQKLQMFNGTLSDLSHQTTKQIKIGSKQQINEKKNNLDEQYKKQPSKKNSISQNQFKEEDDDEYSYEEEEEEEIDDEEYEYEEDEQSDNQKQQKEEQKNQGIDRTIIDYLITLDPNKNQMINIESSQVNHQQDVNDLKQRSPTQQNIIANRNLYLDLNLQGQKMSQSPTFGEGQQYFNSKLKELKNNSNKNSCDIENQNIQEDKQQSIQPQELIQATRIQNNHYNPEQSTDKNNKKMINNSRKVNPLILPSLNPINQPQQSQSPNQRDNYQFNSENMQMYNNIQIYNQNGNMRYSNNEINDSQNIKILKSYNSIARGPTPVRQYVQQISQQDQKEKIQIRSIEQQNNPQIPQENEQVHCKICLETDSTKETGKLITPCKCSGTLRNVHEECLKTWIITQQKEIMEAQCEVCKKPYEQQITFGYKFNLANSFKDGRVSCLTSIVIFLLLSGLAIVIGLLFKRNDDIKQQKQIGSKSDSFLDSSTHVISLISICFVSFVILLIIIYFTIKSACFILVVKNWTIEQYVPSPQFDISQQGERTMYQNQNNTHQNQNMYQSIQNRQIITYEQFLRERRSMPTVIGAVSNGNNQNNSHNMQQVIHQSRNSPRSRASQAQSCVTQMQQNNKPKLTKQYKLNQINQLLQQRKKYNKPIIFNQRIFFNSRRQSENDPVRVSQPFI